MIKLNQWAQDWFNRAGKGRPDTALYVDLDDLMGIRRYAELIKYRGVKRAQGVDSGDIKSAFRGRGVEMEEIREYAFGDDVRDIDWRITARKSVPYTKVYEEERNREVWAWLDLSPLMTFGSKKELKSVTAAKLTALLGWVSMYNKDRFGCVIFDGQNNWLFKPQRHKGYMAAICHKIAQVGRSALENSVNDETKRLNSLKLLQASMRRGAGVFIISSLKFWDEQYYKEFAQLAKLAQLYLMNIYDVLEEKAPLTGQYLAEYDGERVLINTENKKYRQEYAKYFHNKGVEWLQQCRKIGCHIIDLTQETDLSKALKIF